MKLRPPAFVTIVLALALGPVVLGTALRAGAALALEALPLFVIGDALAAALARFPAWPIALVAHGGCCDARGRAARPDALVPFLAAGLIAGWPVAIARAAAGVALRSVRSRLVLARPSERAARTSGEHGREEGTHSIGERLLRVAMAGSLASLALSALAGRPAVVESPVAAFALGALVGALFPCGIGAFAVVAALQTTSPACAAGILATSGIVHLTPPLTLRSIFAPRGAVHIRSVATAGDDWPLRTAYGIVCAVAGGANGAMLVTPRFVPALWLAAALALATAAHRARIEFSSRACDTRGSPHSTSRIADGMYWLPIAMLAVLAMRPALPLGSALTTPAAGAPGETITFVGTVATTPTGARIERWEMWCCIADATLLTLPLRDIPRFAPGTWVRASGRLVRTAEGIALAVTGIERVPTPRDPYLYA